MEKQHVPETRLKRLFHWIDRRTGLNNILKISLDEPIPGGARWAYVFGSGLLFIFISQVITGLCLAIYYVPSAQNAHVSVAYITKEVTAGDFLRSLHYYGSSAMLIVLALHFLQTFLYGAYKGRRELLWISGGVLAFLVLGMAFTGYLLPWDQKAYFATAVGTNLVSQVPLVGGWMARFMRGGDTIGTLTLSRFYIAHVMLIPGCIFAIIATHIYLFRKAGAAGPISENPVKPQLPPESFYPKQVIMDMVFATVLMVVLGLFAQFHPIGLGPRANPAASNYLPRPEWYFLPFFEWLKFWEGPRTIFGVVLVPAILALLFFCLPFLDRRLERRPWRRPVPLLAVSVVLLGMAYLGFLSHYQDMHDTGVRRQLALQAAQEKAYDDSPFKPFMQTPGSINVLQPASSNPIVARGKALFAQNGCSGCHGQTGRGAIGPSLVGIGKQFAPPALVALLHHPSAAMTNAGMPTPDLSDRDLKALVAYLDALGTPAENVEPDMSASPEPTLASASSAAPPAAQTASSSASAPPATGAQSALVAQGHQIFQAQACFACHGNMAQGTQHAPTLAGWAVRTPASVIQTDIVNPTPAMRAKGMMPHQLSPDQLDALVAFLKSLPSPSENTAPEQKPVTPHVTLASHSGPAPAPPAVSTVSHPVTAAPAGSTEASEVAAGRRVFEQQPCKVCHGPMAQGTKIAPPLTGIWRQISESQFDSLIHHPTKAMTAKGMPPAMVSPTQTHEIWAFLKSLPAPANAAKAAPAASAAESAASAPAASTPAAPVATVSAPEAKTAPAVQAPPPAEPKAVVSALTGPEALGKQIFQSHGCIACHGENGVGTRLAVPLIGVTQKFSHSQLADLIRHPNAQMKKGGMPTFTYTDPQMEGLLAYLATLKKPEAAAASAAPSAAPTHPAPPHKLTAEETAGKQIYFNYRCSTCHGSGGMEGTAAAPSLTATASELPPDMLKKLLQHPSDAMRAKGMPPVSLTDTQLNELIAFIRSLRYNR